MSVSESPIPRRSNLFTFFFESLVRPHSTVQEAGARRQARFLAISAFVLTLTNSALMVALMLTIPAEVPSYLSILAPVALATLLAYVLSRTPYFHVGAWLLIIAMSAAGYGLMSVRPESAVSQLGATLPLAYAISILLLNLPEFAFLVIANSVAIATSPLYISGLEPSRMMVQAFVFLVFGGLMVIVASLRNRTETERLDVLHQANRELEAVRAALVEQVEERTADLQRRTRELQAAAQVAHGTLAMQDVTALLGHVTRLISEQFDYYHAGIFLLDDRGEYAVLQAASSEGGQRMLKRGHRLRVGTQGIVGAAAAERHPYIALDVGEDAAFFDNPDLPMTRSEMALPLIVRDKVIGILDIQSTEAQAFDQQSIEVLETLADQIALAIENARLLAESHSTIAQLEVLMAEQSGAAWREHLQKRSHGYVYTPSGLSSLNSKPMRDLRTDNGSPKDQSIEVPISLRGRRIGTIALTRAGNKQWTKKEQTLAADIAIQVGLAVENARLLEDTREQARREQIVAEVSSRMRETLDMDTVLQTAIREMQRTLNLREAEIRLGLPPSDGHQKNAG
ncbi:MAG: GAF domain-containing protein [Chloroflexi bacterium]|nr:GAF domain-containing protein [Chloroflexota bacterium]